MQTPIVMERPQPAVLVASHDVACVDKTCHAHGDSPSVTMALSEPRFVYAIRVRYTATSRLRGMAWRRPGEDAFVPAELGPAPREPRFEVAEKGKAIWVHDAVDQVRLDLPTTSGRLTITGIVFVGSADLSERRSLPGRSGAS